MTGKRSAKPFKLTPRETFAGALLSRGNSRKQIASEMGISVRTVDDYLLKIRHKLSASSMFEAGIILSHYRLRIPSA